MKKILFVVIVGCLLAACSKKPEGFEVHINIKNAPKGRIYVSERIPNPEVWFVDTLYIPSEDVVYKGKVDYPRLTTFTFWRDPDHFLGSVSVFLDNSRVEITGDFDDLKNVTITGSPTHDEYTLIQERGSNLFSRHRELSYERSNSFKDNRPRYDSLEGPYKEAYYQLIEYLMSVPGYTTSQVAPYFITDYIPVDNAADLDKALSLFDPSMRTNGYIADAASRLEREKGSLPGRPAYDFDLKDLDGNRYRLSDFRGKYVLIEFSASWCGWCKLEIPFLKTVYENTRGKNFEMFTINVDDEREKWEKDVEENPVPWLVISDLQALKGDVAHHYNISGIPMIYLIDPQGIILEKGLRRENMIAYINNLFK